MTRASDAIVIGAGIVGAACAWALSRAGLSVRVIDRRGVGAGATGSGMGHIVVMDEPAAEFALTRRSRDLWDEVLPRLPVAAGWRRCGTLWVASDEEEFEAASRKCATLNAAGVAAEALDAPAVARLEPNLKAGLAGGLLVPGDSIVLPPAAAAWMLERTGITGENLVAGRAVRGVESGGVILDDGERLAAGVIVNAAGIWAREISPGLPLRARKGHLVMTDRREGFCTRQVVELGYIKAAHGGGAESVSFNIQPRAGGNLVIGSSRQFDVESEELEPRVLGAMLSKAREFMPALAAIATARTWTGLRAATPDGLPVIGEHPGMPGVYLAGGHEGLGLTMSMGTGELIAAAVTGANPVIDPRPYSPARFAGLLRA
jgi:glycine/D-amino acid oxidase-like deaminating enzyme